MAIAGERSGLGGVYRPVVAAFFGVVRPPRPLVPFAMGGE